MAALQFPANPGNNQTYVGPNGITYKWDGEKWTGESSSTAVTIPQVGGIGSYGLFFWIPGTRDVLPMPFLTEGQEVLGTDLFKIVGTSFADLTGSVYAFNPSDITSTVYSNFVFAFTLHGLPINRSPLGTWRYTGGTHYAYRNLLGLFIRIA